VREKQLRGMVASDVKADDFINLGISHLTASRQENLSQFISCLMLATKDTVYLRVTLTGVMDEVPSKGTTGKSLISDFVNEGCCNLIGVRGGRGIVVARGIREPVITFLVLVFFCYNLAYHLIICGRSFYPTNNRVIVLREKLLKEKIYFSRDLI
jgi:hypothetical protein